MACEARVLARKNLVAQLVATLGLLAASGGCSDTSTRVRLVFTVQEAAFRPDHIDVIWGVVGGEQRSARIPADGPLPATDGNNLGEVLIILDDQEMQTRRFIARGTRGDQRVSGAVANVTWNGGQETIVPMELGCYDDPGIPMPLPGCPTGN
jgi:hypothetical protein